MIIREHNNLTDAWIDVLDIVVNSSGNEISPLVLSITDFEENKNIRDILNQHLKDNKHSSIETVSETIFPNSLYSFCNYDKEKLFSTYLSNLPRLKAIDAAKNGRGTYFERLIAFGDNKKVNQLEIIINALLDKKTRRSKLQASIFDPSKDHINDAYQKFPCLQHVTFYKSESGGLIINSFYAIQILYQKAYGNWLGLINLGKFIARETGLELVKFNCFIGVEQLESTKISKKEAKKLLNKMKVKN
uniref:hypothetical protein n=1 Tax=Flavobacterium sp. TaxID=239 RepID=UPI00404B2364